MHFADGAVADQHLHQAGRHIAGALGGAGKDRLAGKRGQRRLFRWLPDDRVAADQRKRRVPRPDGDGEVEGRDDADDAERMPGFHHAVAGTLGGDGQTVELARQADGEIADVDHFLDFAEAFGRDLADFDGDQAAEIGLGGAQFLAEQADQFAALRRRHHAPDAEGFVGLFDRGGGFRRRNRLQRCDLLARHRAAHDQVAMGEAIPRDAQPIEKLLGFLFDGHLLSPVRAYPALAERVSADVCSGYIARSGASSTGFG